MGLGVYPVFEPPIPEADFDFDGKILLAESAGLEDVAVSHHLTPISFFGDNRPVPDGFEGDPDELDEVLGPWDAWFPVADGLRCIEALARILRADLGARSLVSQPEEIVEELEGLASCLRIAKEKTTSFRLEIG